MPSKLVPVDVHFGKRTIISFYDTQGHEGDTSNKIVYGVYDK